MVPILIDNPIECPICLDTIDSNTSDELNQRLVHQLIKISHEQCSYTVHDVCSKQFNKCLYCRKVLNLTQPTQPNPSRIVFLSDSPEYAEFEYIERFLHMISFNDRLLMNDNTAIIRFMLFVAYTFVFSWAFLIQYFTIVYIITTIKCKYPNMRYYPDSRFNKYILFISYLGVLITNYYFVYQIFF